MVAVRLPSYSSGLKSKCFVDIKHLRKQKTIKENTSRLAQNKHLRVPEIISVVELNVGPSALNQDEVTLKETTIPSCKT